MAYDDWGEEFQEVWEELPGIPFFRDYEREQAEDLFERGFTHKSDEAYYNSDDAKAARDEFFEYTGLPEDMFPWEDWREAMGYDE